MVILAVPYAALEEVARELGEGAAGKVLIDVTNPLKPDFSGLASEGGPSAAEQLAEWVPDAHMAKAFNTVFAGIQADPMSKGTTVDALFGTDDDEARRDRLDPHSLAWLPSRRHRVAERRPPDGGPGLVEHANADGLRR